MVIVLSSGRQIEASKVRLYPEPELQKIVTLRSKAQEELGGFTTGIGFLGSPAWVFGSAAVLGVLESIVSDKKAKKGILHLKEAQKMHEDLQKNGVLFEISVIEGIENPDPANWRADSVYEISFDFSSMGIKERGKFIEERSLTIRQARHLHGQIIKEEVNASFTHDGDEFFWVEIDGQLTAVRWNFVESYQIKLGANVVT